MRLMGYPMLSPCNSCRFLKCYRQALIMNTDFTYLSLSSLVSSFCVCSSSCRSVLWSSCTSWISCFVACSLANSWNIQHSNIHHLTTFNITPKIGQNQKNIWRGIVTPNMKNNFQSNISQKSGEQLKYTASSDNFQSNSANRAKSEKYMKRDCGT